MLENDVSVADPSNNGALMYTANANHATLADNPLLDYASAGTGHGLRVNGSHYFIISRNVFDDNGSTDGFTLRGNQGSQLRSEWGMVQGNTFQGAWTVIKPQFSGSGEGIRRVHWDGNLDYSSVFVQSYAADLGIDDFLFSNNVHIGQPIIYIDPSNDKISGLRYYNNTAYLGSLGTCGTGCTEDNNVVSSTSGDFESITPGDPDFMQPTSPVNGTDVNMHFDYHSKTRANPPDDGAVEVP